MRKATHLAAVLGILCYSTHVLGQAPIVYPAKGQSEEQQSKDDGECYVWAKQKTGVDPAAVQTPSQEEQQAGGERSKGAARGAIGGAAVGSLQGEAGKGAAAGAIVGTIAGARRETAAKEKAQAKQQEQLDTYYRAYGACMQGRGYSIQ